MDISKLIESILFVRGEPIKLARLAALLGQPKSDVESGLKSLEEATRDRGIRLIRNGDEVMLGSAPESSEFVRKMAEEELTGRLTRAALESLAIVVYCGPISRPDIDFIRGVNSSFILRNLAIRGLVDREINPKDKRTFIYTPSMRLLQFLGITKLGDLPDYAEFKTKIDEFSKNADSAEQNISEQPQNNDAQK